MRKFIRFFHNAPSPWPLLFILFGTVTVILYGRGYRPDIKENALNSTGILALRSDPKGAQVYIDNQLKTATDDTINIKPGWYEVKIVKEGYIAWQKKMRVQGEVVTSADPFLFPSNPSLSPVTTVGVENPLLSPDGTKIAYVIPTQAEGNGFPQNKAGLWVYSLTDRPFGFNRDTQQVGTTTAAFDFSQANIIWSPDSNEIMADNGKQVRLYNSSRTNSFQDISANYSFILKDWQQLKDLKIKQQLGSYKPQLVDILQSSSKILSLSPDETKILYQATSSATIPQIIDPPLIGTNSTEEQRNIEADKIYVYDSKEDKNYFVLANSELPQSLTTPSPTTKPKQTTAYELQSNNFLHWFPTSRHLVLTFKGKIDIMEYDRTNWVTVYAGPLLEGFMAPWPNGSRIIIVTNLNPDASTLPNLYTVNLR